MRVDELVTAVRVSGRLSSGDPDYDDSRVRQELTDALHTIFGGRIIAARSGYWLKRLEVAATTGRTRYRLPARASATEAVQSLPGDGLPFEIEGDQVVFHAAPSPGVTLRFVYYIRPSRLVAQQTAGQITAVDTVALTVTVNSLPTDRDSSIAVANGATLDIVHPTGWHELALVGAVGSVSGSVITFPAGTDLTDVEVGDFVRAADQTDWPCIQDDYHRVLADVTAANILRSRSQFQKADALMQKALGTPQEPGDLRRFSDVIEPRVKEGRQSLVPTVGVLRGRYRRRWPAATP